MVDLATAAAPDEAHALIGAVHAGNRRSWDQQNDALLRSSRCGRYSFTQPAGGAFHGRVAVTSNRFLQPLRSDVFVRARRRVLDHAVRIETYQENSAFRVRKADCGVSSFFRKLILAFAPPLDFKNASLDVDGRSGAQALDEAREAPKQFVGRHRHPILLEGCCHANLLF